MALTSKLHAFGSVSGLTPAGEYPYLEKYVAFLDILGFKGLVELADTSSSNRAELVQILHDFRTTCGEHEIFGIRITQFSDSLVITSNRSELGLDALFRGCSWLVINLIQFGVLLRGGIALGSVTHERDMLFGIGVNCAYEFNASGKNPRIGVDKRVDADLSSLSRWKYITSDHENGEPILHTLRELEYYDPNPPLAGMISWDRHAKDISNLIRDKIADMNTSEAARKKWKWFGQYWNITVSSKGILPKV